MNYFNYYAPETLDECLKFKSTYGFESNILAGGTDLLPAINRGKIRSKALISIRKITALKGFEAKPDGSCHIGASLTVSGLMRSEAVYRRHTSLWEAARTLGTYQVRNVATVAGNLCNASPAADLAAPLLALDSLILVSGPGGSRTIPIAGFFAAPGKTVLLPDEVVTGIILPTPARNVVSAYIKFGPRSAVDLALVGVAACLELDTSGRCINARVALSGVNPVPLRLAEVEQNILGCRLKDLPEDRIKDLVGEGTAPIGDLRGSADFKREMARLFTVRTLKRAFGYWREGS
jgi:carbon-monoxide dehydrogenase medium subunit